MHGLSEQGPLPPLCLTTHPTGHAPLPLCPRCGCPAGVRSNIPTSEPGVTQRVVYSWAVRLQGPEAGPQFHNCWMTESVHPISQSLFK